MSNSEKEKDKKDESPEPEKADSDKIVPPEVEEVLKTAPPEVRKAILQMASVSISGPSRSPFHLLFQKFLPQHIDKLLDAFRQDDLNEYNLKRSGRWFHLGYVGVILAFIIFLVVFLAKDDPPLLTDIIRIIAIFAGGFGSGFGVKSFLDKK